MSLGAGFSPLIYLVEYFYIEKLIKYLVTLRNTLDRCLISSLYLH